MKSITLKEAKKRMLEYTDFFGGDFSQTDLIENAKSKVELYKVFEQHRNLLEDMLADAQSHLENFKRELGVSSF